VRIADEGEDPLRGGVDHDPRRQQTRVFGVEDLSPRRAYTTTLLISPRFFNATSGTLQQVLDYMAFDVAFLVLESDLAAPEVAGILTADQVKSLVDSAVTVTAPGYG